MIQTDNEALPVQRILCLLKSRSHSGPSTSPHSSRCSRSCHRHTHHCKLSSPFCDWNHLPGPVDAAVFFLHSKPGGEKELPLEPCLEVQLKERGKSTFIQHPVGFKVQLLQVENQAVLSSYRCV